MQVNLDFDPKAYTILSYGVEGVRVRLPIEPPTGEQQVKPVEEVLSHSCVIFPDRLVRDWAVSRVDTLTTADLGIVLERRPEVLLLGTGEKLHFPPSAVTAPLLAAGIGVEVMGNGAACRTYNVLMTEGRYVALALMQPPQH